MIDVAKLTRRQRHRAVLCWRDIDGLTLREIGERLGLSRERVRQVYAEAQREPRLSGLPENYTVPTLGQAVLVHYYADILMHWARSGT